MKTDDYRIMPIPGFEGYFCSNYGDAFSSRKRYFENGKYITKITKELIRMTPSNHEDGYLFFTIFNGKSFKQMLAHRLVMICFSGEERNDLVLHYDGNPKNNYFGNLRWGTHADNHEDQRRHGTLAIGKRNSMAKLTEDEVRRIRRMRKEGHSTKNIANLFKISESHCCSIVSRKKWANLTDLEALGAQETEGK